MTTKTSEAVDAAEQLAKRNKAVQRAYSNITKAVKPLLSPFSSQKYRTFISVEHSKSDKDTNLINEYLCCFFNITLTKNKVGYYMLYLTYDQEAYSKFGARLFNRVLRQLFAHTETKETEDCIRVNNHGNVQGFFINRLAHGENVFTKIEIEEHSN